MKYKVKLKFKNCKESIYNKEYNLIIFYLKKFMEIKKFHINKDNLDDVNLKLYEDDNEQNNNDKDNKNSIEIIRRQEYLLQMKTEVKFPIYQILQKFNYIQENEEYKLCSKIRIDSSKKNFINYIKNSNLIKNANLDISNEIFEEDLKNKNNQILSDFDDSDEIITGYLFIFQTKIILTNNQIENLKKSLKKNPVLYSIKFSQFCIFRLIIHDTSPNELYLQFYDKTFSFKKDLMLKFLLTRDSFCVHHFIKKYFILQWQIIFESTIILNYKKLIYNRHYILLKYNKYGKCQERTLLVTNGLLLNIKHDFKKNGLHFSLKNIQWAIGIKAIKKIVIMIESKSENKLKIYLDKIINNAEVIEFLGETKFLKFKQERNFEFYSVDERNDFVGLMRRNYFLLTNKFIKIDCYPPLNRKKLGSKTIIENNIFDSSFESSDEELKISNKEKEKDKEKNDINRIEVEKDDIKNDVKEEENNDIIIKKEEKIDKNEIEKENVIQEGNNVVNNVKNPENENQIKVIKSDIIYNKDKDDEHKKDKDKIFNKNIDTNENKEKNKNIPEKKKLKKTKRSIFDEKYNSIFDSDYESEEDD